MGIFDIEKAAKVLGQQGQGGLLNAIGTGFGAPSCFMDMTKDLMNLLPTGMLGEIGKSVEEGKQEALDWIAKKTADIFTENGLIQFDTNSGKWKFVSDSSKFGLDYNESGLLKDLGGIVGSMGYWMGFGGALYNQYEVTKNQIGDLLDCLDGFKNILASKKGVGSMAASLGLQSAGQCVGCAGDCTQITTPQACVAAEGTWVVDPPAGTCYGADGGDPPDKDICEGNGGVWSPPIDPPGGIGAFGPNQAPPEVQFAYLRNELQETLDFADKAQNQLDLIAEVLNDRAVDPTLEPVFVVGPGGIPEDIFSGTTLRRATSDMWGDILEGGAGLDAQGNPIPTPPEIFRLTYGPPKARRGQFILTIDGLYYDSQSGGVPEVPQKFIPPGQVYLHKYAPNLGGKGVPIGERELDIFMDTLFDPAEVREWTELRRYYESDHFLQQLIGEKNKHVNDLNKTLNQMVTDGSGTSIIYNMRQSIVSHIAKHDQKIDKRKKQIEVAVVTPGTFGSLAQTPVHGEIPINDFSYLKDYNVKVSLELQKNLVFNQAEVKDIILPITPKYTVASGVDSGLLANHLRVPTIGAAGIIFDSSTTGERPVTLLNLTDEIVDDNLFAVYNFLESTKEQPTVDPYDTNAKWGVLNCVASGLQIGSNIENPIIKENAKLLAHPDSEVFPSGLSIPKLTGLVRYSSDGLSTSLGNAVRLPDSNSFRDLFYSMDGATIEAWVHMPGVNTSSTDYSEPNGEWGPHTYNRVLLGAENSGGLNDEIEDDIIPNTFGSEHVRGFLMGFSRDRQVVNDFDPSNDADDNPTEDMCFFAAPTTSYNSSGISFVNTEEAYCSKLNQIYKFKVDTDVVGSNQKSLNDVSGEFMHIVYTVDPSSNTMSLYLDGELLSSSAIDTCFGLQNPYSFLALPTWYKTDINSQSEASFEYNTISTSGGTGFTNGPKLDSLYTPWILGGGYTDGFLKYQNGSESSLPEAGGFMNKYHGRISGLNGYIGSVKFYSRALRNKEIVKNYKAQEAYFKNIDVTPYES